MQVMAPDSQVKYPVGQSWKEQSTIVYIKKPQNLLQVNTLDLCFKKGNYIANIHEQQNEKVIPYLISLWHHK
jgi:hypothetical protein